MKDSKNQPKHLNREPEKRIGIFGGSFDPVHEGHIHLAKLAKDGAGLDEVWFLPCNISPHKRDRAPSTGADRVRWLKIATRDLPWAKIDETDLRTEGLSYSYRTLETLAEEYPENEWFWIMGGDQWAALPTWKNPGRIAELAGFVVLARDGQEIHPREGYRLNIVTGEHPGSSTVIREAIEGGETEIPYLNPELAELLVPRQDGEKTGGL